MMTRSSSPDAYEEALAAVRETRIADALERSRARLPTTARAPWILPRKRTDPVAGNAISAAAPVPLAERPARCSRRAPARSPRVRPARRAHGAYR
jgi:hypothetical protein